MTPPSTIFNAALSPSIVEELILSAEPDPLSAASAALPALASPVLDPLPALVDVVADVDVVMDVVVDVVEDVVVDVVEDDSTLELRVTVIGGDRLSMAGLVLTLDKKLADTACSAAGCTTATTGSAMIDAVRFSGWIRL